ncbi:MAG: type II toxin-antitoxin system RelE family toxin [Mangrovibacterium sp.]
MIVKFSKSFQKAAVKLSGSNRVALQKALIEAENAQNVESLTDCKPIQTVEGMYRKRIKDLRAFFSIHFTVEDNEIHFHYLVPRGQAYSKKIISNLRKL